MLSFLSSSSTEDNSIQHSSNDDEILDAYSRTITQVVEKASNSVVQIKVWKKAVQNPNQRLRQPQEAGGSGFIISSDGFVIALADMPYINSQTTSAIASKLSEGASIVVPTYQGKRGHPVGFSAKFRGELESLHGDEGARSILKRYPDEVVFLECDDSGILADIDTPADLKL